jgi:hypothetical protein
MCVTSKDSWRRKIKIWVRAFQVKIILKEGHQFTRWGGGQGTLFGTVAISVYNREGECLQPSSSWLWQACYYYVGGLCPEVLLKGNHTSNAVGWIPGIIVKKEGSAIPVFPTRKVEYKFLETIFIGCLHEIHDGCVNHSEEWCVFIYIYKQRLYQNHEIQERKLNWDLEFVLIITSLIIFFMYMLAVLCQLSNIIFLMIRGNHHIWYICCFYFNKYKYLG